VHLSTQGNIQYITLDIIKRNINIKYMMYEFYEIHCNSLNSVNSRVICGCILKDTYFREYFSSEYSVLITLCLTILMLCK
jgi:hypothetical protein